MKRLIISLAALLIIATEPSIAGEQTGHILDIRVSSKPPTHIRLSGDYKDKPACATTGWWAMDTDTSAGKNFLATVILAQAQKLKTTFHGNGTCYTTSGMESLGQIDLGYL